LKDAGKKGSHKKWKNKIKKDGALPKKIQRGGGRSKIEGRFGHQWREEKPAGKKTITTFKCGKDLHEARALHKNRYNSRKRQPPKRKIVGKGEGECHPEINRAHPSGEGGVEVQTYLGLNKRGEWEKGHGGRKVRSGRKRFAQKKGSLGGVEQTRPNWGGWGKRRERGWRWRRLSQHIRGGGKGDKNVKKKRTGLMRRTAIRHAINLQWRPLFSDQVSRERPWNRTDNQKNLNINRQIPYSGHSRVKRKR